MDTITQLKEKLRGIKRMIKWFLNQSSFVNRLGYRASNAILELPCVIDSPEGVYLYENTRLRSNCCILNSPERKVIINKYSAIACGCTFITNGHKSTVSIPHIILGASHINDKSGDIIIGEDVWVGANCTFMPGVNIGRGAVIGSGALVTKDVPPYAVVVGSPAKIVAKKFELDDIIRHEQHLYSESERMTKQELDKIFEANFQGKKVFGTNQPLTSDDNLRLQSVKRSFRFIEPF